MQIFGSRELLEAVLKKDLCIGCGACVELCPYFKTYKGKSAMLFPCTLSRGQCFAFCPKRNIQVENPVAVLDQEEAKKFLLGKAEDKHKFFMSHPEPQ